MIQFNYECSLIFRETFGGTDIGRSCSNRRCTCPCDRTDCYHFDYEQGQSISAIRPAEVRRIIQLTYHNRWHSLKRKKNWIMVVEKTIRLVTLLARTGALLPSAKVCPSGGSWCLISPKWEPSDENQTVLHTQVYTNWNFRRKVLFNQSEHWYSTIKNISYAHAAAVVLFSFSFIPSSCSIACIVNEHGPDIYSIVLIYEFRM